MKRAVAIVLGGYILLALGNKAAEAAGAIRCGCANECWCKRPGLNLFRWVFPWEHTSRLTDEEKVKAALPKP
ncbi:hypothetical protein SAMN05192575_109130 [Nocardioides alpinus]|uniref:Virus attachment protein p12 family protein n=1 Tax=Nocardioides alpinus TaxID=748909 RepID=A0A1I1AK48_9ACTN|nr:hypothetical protein [Nocardioides alpinus]SFB38394.1 hypothetical protein SAMN05192575_109130 [Nocardioides alpinus]